MNSKVKDLPERFFNILKKNKYIAALLAVGLAILLWPTHKASDNGTLTQDSSDAVSAGFALDEEERRLAQVLSRIDGAGEVSVLLTLKSDAERMIAYDSESSLSESGRSDDSVQAVIVSTGSGTNDVVTVSYIYPEYSGAVVVAQGAGSASVRLALTRAVGAATGLNSDRIVVAKMK